MARPLPKSTFLLLALGLWILGYPASWAEDDGLESLNQQVDRLFEQGKYEAAIPIAERAVDSNKARSGSGAPRDSRCPG